MTDCGCTTIWIWSGVIPNSHFASIISKPLFIIEAESIVILAPIVQFGCFSACAFVTCASSSSDLLRKGPPEAVSNIFSTGLSPAPVKHWKMAECSESTGRIGTRYSSAKPMINSPATTRVSLLAKAIALPFLIASIVGRKPA